MTCRIGGGINAMAMFDRFNTDNPAEFGQLLERYRNELRVAATVLHGPTLRSKIDPSDLVQETFLKAIRDFSNFQGAGERELLGWLRKILIHCLADHVKHHRRGIRDVARQKSLDVLFWNPRTPLHGTPTSPGPSPSEAAVRREQSVLLAEAVDRLPADYRQVYLLRTLHHLPFEVIALRMGRSIGAVRMLWVRAIEKLSIMLKESQSD